MFFHLIHDMLFSSCMRLPSQELIGTLFSVFHTKSKVYFLVGGDCLTYFNFSSSEIRRCNTEFGAGNAPSLPKDLQGCCFKSNKKRKVSGTSRFLM